MERANRPLPTPSVETEAYWEACREHRLVIQHCTGCDTWRHYPRPMCPHCHSTAFEWDEATGRGVIHSYTVAHHAFHPYWEDKTPYVVATIELEEGVRVVSDMVELDPADVAIGLRVEVIFEDLSDEISLPRFRVLEQHEEPVT